MLNMAMANKTAAAAMVFLKLNVSGSKYFLFDYRSCFESKSFDTIFFFFS